MEQANESEAELVGYTDRLSVAPGERFSCLVSSTEPFEARLVRLRHGDRNPAGPGHRDTVVSSEIDGEYPARIQVTHAGSCAVGPPIPALGTPGQALSMCAWAYPTRLATAKPQAVLATGPDLGGFALLVEPDGRVLLKLDADERGPSLRSSKRVTERRWHFIAAIIGTDGELRLRVTPAHPAPDSVWEETAVAPEETGSGARPGVVVIGASPIRSTDGPPETDQHFNGKIEAPSLYLRALSDDEFDLAAEGAVTALDPLLSWDFAAGDQQSKHVIDIGPHHHDGELVNLPTRAVTGHNWTGAEVDFRQAPAQYAAVHFHDDDLEDAKWAPSFSWTVPEKFRSGVYAFRLTGAAGATDYVPFAVKPRRGEADHDVALLLPTNTYLAYANERLLFEGAATEQQAATDVSTLVPHHAELLASEHQEWGISAYDRHSDGSGCCYSSRLRPIPNMRPDYRYWSTGAPERFPSDLYITDWLEEKDFGYDVFTDEDLHFEGAERLARYRVVLTGTHPEYWTGRMIDALETYLASGGHVMYLGGNGFFWVTSIPENAPHVVEIRRGVAGTRPWTSEPGEGVHSNGEPGGLWRYRGRDPRRLAGVGFTAFALSDPASRASGYVRCADSFREEVRFIFDGVDSDEIIGEFGLINEGAAGYEIDRFDHALGTPRHALRLATSRGRHGDDYLLVIEDLEFSQADLGGSVNDLVGADMAYLEHPNGGAIFSVGSCNWCGSLSHNKYANNVSRITENVLRRFASPDPLPTGATGQA